MALYHAGSFVKARTLDNRIKAIEALIKEAEEYEPKKLSELLDQETMRKHRLSEKMVALHLAADFVAECGHDLKGTLAKLGLHQCSLLPMVKEITDNAQAFASLVCHPSFAGLSDFMCENEEYLDELQRVTYEYISRKLQIT